jgi:hypothetical protein
VDEVGGTCGTNEGEEERVYFIGRKARGKEVARKTQSRWIDKIKMDLLEIGMSVVDWIGLAQDRYRWRAVVNSVMNLRVTQNAGNLPSGYTSCGLSSGTHLHIVS